jgi:segregation and condensation protein A
MFRVELDHYRGPLDLLLFLVRKHEVNIREIPIAQITDQYLGYIAILEEMDINAVGDFLELASLLIEIKARLLLPQQEESEQEWDDPRKELVQRLLEYKKYKDAASMLEDQGRSWQQTFARQSVDLPERQVDLTQQPIREVELWDLVSALGRTLNRMKPNPSTSIVYDDTPIHVHMETLYDRLRSQERVAITEVLNTNMRKPQIIGMFLAVLELVRHHSVEAEQEGLSGEIWVIPGPNFGDPIDLSNVDAYEGEKDS